MATDIIPQFDDPVTVARHLGETVGTHYSAALRAADAYGRHLAPKRESLSSGDIDRDSLGNFWRELVKTERIRIGSIKVLKELSTTPMHFFSEFLDTADEVYRKRYQDVSPAMRKSAMNTQHAQCLHFLRTHSAQGVPDRFTVQNKVTMWLQLLRMTGKYQE
jgi:hypothetical protein